MSEDFFTPRAQFRRVLARDWNVYHKDIFWGAFYALVGFFFSSPRYDPPTGVQGVYLPFLLLSLAVAIMTYRLCQKEAQPATAQFYFNLPRRHDLAQAAHLTLLAAMTLGHEMLIMLAATLGLRLPPGATGYAFPPHMMVLPLFTMAVVNWFVYLPRKNEWRSGSGITALGIIAFIAVFSSYLSYSACKVKHKTGFHEAIDTTILLMLGAFLFIDALRRWRAVQIGELS